MRLSELLSGAPLDGTLFKLGSIRGETITQFRYSNTFQIERTTGPDRLRIGAEDGHISWLFRLAVPLSPPFFLLYVLHTSRCGNELGRYQSPEIQFSEVDAFMTEFCEFLTDDGRHDLWLRSMGSEATLVWDRHDLIYAYGPLEEFRTVLNEGLQEAEVGSPPIPHVHLYHAAYDDSERKILTYFQWSRSPLLEDDEQV